jgi:MarR family transcriptional regulator, organic hydroperoxide resistance regulator
MVTETETIARRVPASASIALPRVPLARSLGYHLRQLSESWTDALHKTTEKVGVTEGQWRYLRELWEEDGLSQRELSERVGRQGPSTVAAVKLLERNGLVTVVPNPDDRRKTGVFLTARGRALQGELGPAILAVQQVGIEGVAPADLETFKRVLVAIQRNLDARHKSRNFWSGSRTDQFAKEVGL